MSILGATLFNEVLGFDPSSELPTQINHIQAFHASVMQNVPDHIREQVDAACEQPMIKIRKDVTYTFEVNGSTVSASRNQLALEQVLHENIEALIEVLHTLITLNMTWKARSARRRLKRSVRTYLQLQKQYLWNID